MGLVAATDGTVSARYAYGPFGEPLRATGPQAVNPFRFSTKYRDAETGLYYYGYRYYDPVTGRWLTKDTIGEGGGYNLYGVVANHPIYSFDPFGLEDFPFQFAVHDAPWRKRSWTPLSGEIIVSVDDTEGGQGIQIAFKVKRPNTAANKHHWKT